MHRLLILVVGWQRNALSPCPDAVPPYQIGDDADHSNTADNTSCNPRNVDRGTWLRRLWQFIEWLTDGARAGVATRFGGNEQALRPLWTIFGADELLRSVANQANLSSPCQSIHRRIIHRGW